MSTSIESLGASWQAVQMEAAGWHLPELSVVWIKHTSDRLSDKELDAREADALRAAEADALRAAEADRGWLRFQSATFEGAWSPSEDWRDPNRRGRLLWAEWADPAPDGGEMQTSYRIAPDPENLGGARRHTYNESSVAADGFVQVLAQDAILQGHSAGRDLCYRVYWGAPDGDPSVIRRLFARFVGFFEVRS